MPLHISTKMFSRAKARVHVPRRLASLHCLALPAWEQLLLLWKSSVQEQSARDLSLSCIRFLCFNSRNFPYSDRLMTQQRSASYVVQYWRPRKCRQLNIPHARVASFIYRILLRIMCLWLLWQSLIGLIDMLQKRTLHSFQSQRFYVSGEPW